MDLRRVFAVALGGILGSLLRYVLSLTFDHTRAGTLTANLLGVAAAGLFLVYAERRATDFLRHLLLPGFCGGLTTFSAVAVETMRTTHGFWYLLLTLLLSLLVVSIAIPAARKIIAVRS
jgi:fluoride exporter